MAPRSPSNSRSPHSRGNSRQRYRSGGSRSASKSPDYRRERASSRSRSPRRGGGGGGRHGGNFRDRENPAPSKCLGVFNLSSYTSDKDLRDVFGEFGDIDKCELVYDRPSGNSRGFGFIYYKNIDDATAARDKLCGTDLDGHKIRVDYSFTNRGHSPTPGHYKGERHPANFGGRDRFDYRGRGDRYGGGGRRSPERRSSYNGGGGGYGYRSGGGGGGDRYERNGSGRRDDGGSRRPYDPNHRRRVESYGNGASSAGRRRDDRY